VFVLPGTARTIPRFVRCVVKTELDAASTAATRKLLQ
jgi:hypothetical protein